MEPSKNKILIFYKIYIGESSRTQVLFNINIILFF
jgi:hypothetical protein